jgi:hypothetical protein
MKKTNFLKSVAALVLGCMFTSCEKEDLSATFQAGPAMVTINTEVFDGLTGKQIDNSKVTFNASDNQFNAAINATAPFPSGVKATDLIITATVNGKPAVSTIKILETKVGGTATYSARFIVADGLKFISKAGESTTKEGWANFTGWGHAASHSYEGNSNWYFNATDYAQPFKVVEEYNTITEASELTKTAVFDKLDELYQKGIVATYNTMITGETYTEILEKKAPAWSYFNVKAIATITTTNWSVTTEASEELVATFSTTGTSGINLQLKYFANPGHEGHYGHGNDSHGNNQNAGGGISWAE